MIFIPFLIAAFILLLIYVRPGTRACRWRADRARDAEGKSFFRCAACGAEVMSDSAKPPRDCRKP